MDTFGVPQRINMQNQVNPLFAYPLVIIGKRYTFTHEEKQYIADLEMINNDGNSMSKDDKILDNQPLSTLREFIDKNLFIYKKELLRIKDENEIFITQSWINRSAVGDYHPPHKHPNSIISGVLFLNDNSDDDLPSIRFHRSHEMFPLALSFDELTDFNADSKEFAPQEGMLILFPSLLKHEVGKNESGRERSSLSFNTFVRGTVGGRKQLTEVELS